MPRLVPIFFLIIMLLSACAPAISGPAQIAPPFPPSGHFDEDTPRIIPVETGWFDGENIAYYNLGTNTPINSEDPTRVSVAPGWLLVTSVNPDGTPNRIEGQYTIFDLEPGDEGHSDLWQIYFAWPPQDYKANSIQSLEALQAAGYQIDKSPMLVNCPYAAIGSSLSDGSRELKYSWVADEKYAYFDFGVTSAEPGNLYAIIIGFDPNQQPVLAPGQHFIFDASRDRPGYSDFWRVHWVLVDDGYKPDSLRSLSDIQKNIDPQNIFDSEIIVNYPHK